jgi:hypothetical protein
VLQARTHRRLGNVEGDAVAETIEEHSSLNSFQVRSATL